MTEKKIVIKKVRKEKKKISGVLKFWLAVVVVYITTFLIRPDYFWESLKITKETLIEIIPIILLIFAIMVLTNLFLTPERVKKHFGHEAGWKGWFYAMVFGILVAGPPYALYPMLKQMKEHGLKTSYLTTFLYNRNIKIPLIPAMVYYFGWEYTIVMTILVIIFSIINGLIMEKIID